MKRSYYRHIVCLILLVTSINQVVKAQNYLKLNSLITEFGTKQARDSILLKTGFECIPTNNLYLELILGANSIEPTNYLTEAPDPNNRVLDKTREIGSIQGSFNVTPTGAATYSIPIKVPKGTGNIMPGLSVGYSSQSGDGLLGTKWSLGGISMITRVRNDSYHDDCLDPVDFDGNDRYVWNGQYLIYDDEDNHYKTEQESYAEIRAVGTSGDGPLYWKIKTKDGMEYFYGYSEDSRHQEQNSNSVLRWMITKVKDPYSNFMMYYYHEDQSNGEYWLDRIEYTGNIDENKNPYNTVKFNYSERTDTRLQYIGGSAVRSTVILDNITSYTDNEFVNSYRFRYVYEDYVSKLVEIEEVGTYGEKYNTTIVDWRDESEHIDVVRATDAFSKINYKIINNEIYYGTPVIGDYSGDGRDDIFWYYSKYNGNHICKYYRLYHSTGSSFTLVAEGSLDLINPKFTPGDFNADGKIDLLQKCEILDVAVQVDLLISYGSNFSFIELGSQAPFTIGFYSINNCIETNYYAMDINADGQADLITDYVVFTGNDVLWNYIYYTDFDFSSTLTSSTEELVSTLFQEHYPNRYPADFNGDGRNDIMLMFEEGDGYAKLYEHNNPSTVNDLLFYDGYPTGWHDVLFGDFNADGLYDILSYVDEDVNGTTGTDLWQLFYNDGDFSDVSDNCFNWTNRTPISRDAEFDTYVGDMYHIADFNGDGYDDILESYILNDTTANFTFYYATGTEFDQKTITVPFYLLDHIPYSKSSSVKPLLSLNMTFGYFNDDLSCDICLISQYSRDGCYFIYGKNDSPEYIIDTICNGMNQKIAIETEFGTQDDELCTNPNPVDYPFMPFNGRALLTKATYSQIDETNWNETNYYYRNGKIHLEGKGFLGFGEVKIENVTTEFETKTRYTTLSDVWIPVPTWQESKGPNGQLLSLTTNTYDLIDHSGNSDFSRYTIRPNTTDQCDILHGNIHQITSYNQYDNYGNPTLITKTNSEVTLTTNISYTLANTPVPAKPQNITKTISRNGEVDFVTTESIDYNSFGTASSVKVNESFEELGMQTDYSYDPYGNIIKVQTKDFSNNPEIRSMIYGWDDDHKRFKISATNDLGYTTTSKYNNRLGVVEVVEDENGFITKFSHNGFGRRVMEVYPDGNSANTDLCWNNSAHEQVGTLYHILSTDNAGSLALAYYDQFGRKIYTETEGFNGETILTKTEYDHLGRLTKSWGSYFSNETPVTYTENSYDELQRIDEVHSFPNNTFTSYSYSGNTLTTNLHAGGTTRSKTVVKNSVGEVICSTDDGGLIEYDYYSNGQVKNISYDGLTTLLEYDINGNRTKIIDPDAGEQTALYNAYNEIVTAHDAEENITSYTYDELGRIETKIEPEGITSWTYSTIPGKLGTLESINSPNNTVQYNYDELLRLTKETTSINNESFDFQYDYDIFGRQCGLTFPSGYHINTEYNSDNYMSRIVANNGVVIHRPSRYNARGQITSAYTNDQWLTNYAYDQYGMMYSKEVRDRNNGSFIIQDDNYLFDYELGNMDSRSNMFSQSETFEYDNLDRLTSERINTSTNATSYFSNGSINIKTDVGTYGYEPATKPPHAVSEITNPATYAPTDPQHINYTSFKKVSQITQGTNKYTIWYDHNHNRIKSEFVRSNAAKEDDVLKQRKYYLGNYEVDVKSDGSKRMLHYIGGESGTAAVYVLHSTGEDTLYSVFTDHLGSWKTVVNETDGQISRQSFDAWGRHRDPENWNSSVNSVFPFDRGYTGHQHLKYFGLINMNGRMYDAGICRFLSPDPYVQAPDFTQNFNRYSYCYNNPLVYTDSSGEFIFSLATLIAAPFTGGASLALLPAAIGADFGTWQGGTLANGGEMNPFKWDYSSGKTWGYMLGGAAVGAASGYVGGAVAAEGGFMANTMGIMTASHINSVGMEILSGGQTDYTLSFGVASYNFTQGEWGYLGKPGNSALENIGYGFGALANLQDVVAGFNGTNIDVKARPKLAGHSQIEGSYNNQDILISVGPADQSIGQGHGLKWEMAYVKRTLQGNSVNGENVAYIRPSHPQLVTKLNNVNGKWLSSMTNRLNSSTNLLNTGALKYGLLKGCVNYTSRSLLYSGVVNVNAFLPVTAPVLLNAELFIRQMGMYASPYLINY